MFKEHPHENFMQQDISYVNHEYGTFRTNKSFVELANMSRRMINDEVNIQEPSFAHAFDSTFDALLKAGGLTSMQANIHEAFTRTEFLVNLLANFTFFSINYLLAQRTQVPDLPPFPRKPIINPATDIAKFILILRHKKAMKNFMHSEGVLDDEPSANRINDF